MTIEQAIDDLMDTSKSIAEVAESESDEANRINAQNFADDCEQLAAWLRELVERRKEPKIVHCGECKHSRVWGCELYCTKWVRYTSHNGYCHRGAERRTDG